MARRLTIHQKASFLGDIIFAASDGIITTFAIVAGSTGAGFDNHVILILGFANLFADSFSMASSNFLGVKSETEYKEARNRESKKEGLPIIHALITFTSFVLVGLVPLVPFIFNFQNAFTSSMVFVVLAMFLVGFIRSVYTKKGVLKCVAEMLFVGGLAALAAFAIGFFVENYVL
jgi:VIT1/CCC1 family predicted Fe2+/Mn2+ transporter